MNLIILAAGMGTRLKPLTDDKPKILTVLDGKTLLERQLDCATAAGLNNVVLIGGYRAEQLRGHGADLLINEDFATTNMVQTLFCARQYFGNDFIMSYGDIVYGKAVLAKLIEAQGEVAVVVDTGWRSYWEQRFADPLSDAESLVIGQQQRITSIGQQVSHIGDIEAQYIGLVRFRESGVTRLIRSYKAARAGKLRRPGAGEPLDVNRMYMTDLLQAMAQEQPGISALKINGNWLEIDSVHDFELAERLVRQGRLH